MLKVAIVMRVSVLTLLLGWEIFGTSTWAASPQSGTPLPDATTDDFLAAVSARSPAFGGLFIGPDGLLYVYMVGEETPAALASVESAIAEIYGRERLPLDRMLVLKADYSFAQLKAWHDLMSPVVLALPGVVLTDIDEARNRLRVGVETRKIQDFVEEHLIDLGVPLDAVIVEETEPVRMIDPVIVEEPDMDEPDVEELVSSTSENLCRPIPSFFTLRSRVRPLFGGIQISRSTGRFSSVACTLGFNVIRQGVDFLDPAADVNGFVTNSHCTGTFGGLEGTVFHQPSRPAFFRRNRNRVGVEAVDPAFFTGGPCPKGRRCRFSDSAFVRSSVRTALGFISRPNLNSIVPCVEPYRITDTLVISTVGDVVEKVGRTTGRTQGTVTATCSPANVLNTDITLLCQNHASLRSAAGDSGSPVVLPITASEVLLYGILWGGNVDSVFSPIANVQRTDELGPLFTMVPEN